MTSTYRIVIVKYDDADTKQPTQAVTIECESTFTLARDIPEWILAEVDPRASIESVDPNDSVTGVRQLNMELWPECSVNKPHNATECNGVHWGSDDT